MSGRTLLVSDLDGTLLGDHYSLAVFGEWLELKRGKLALAYATGRTSREVRFLVSQRPALPAPDFVIGSVGTEITDFSTGEIVTQWLDTVSPGWDTHRVRASLASFYELQLQPSEFQSSYKVSYYLPQGNPRRIAEIDATLTGAGIDAEIIFSCGRFLDILPRGMHKGSAARFVAHLLNTPRVIVCGDSGNDLPLFHQRFYGVIVANAHPELSQLEGDRVYRSPFSHAAGVVDGFEYWQKEWDSVKSTQFQA